MKKINQKKALKNFSLPSGWSLKKIKNKAPLLITKEGLVFGLDFKEKKPLTPRQPLVKALGFKGQSLFVLDVTAGWTQEAYLISQLGCSVTAIESNPFVFYFVQESLAQKELKTSSLKLILDDSLNYLDNIKEKNRPDVIYIDPMFGDRKKSLSRKPLKILKELVGEAKDTQLLFKMALKKTKNRVVVKRHHLESPLHKNKICSFKGRSVCYDVFIPKKGSLV